MPQKAAAVAIVEAEPQGTLATFGDPTPMQEHPAHGDLELNFVYAGSLSYFIGGRFVDVPPGSLSVFWGALPHQIVEAEQGTEFMQARLPLATLLRWGLPPAFIRKVLGGEMVTDLQSPAWDAELTRRWVADSSSADAGALHICELELEARLRRLATKRQQKSAPRSPEHKPRRQVEAITAFLAENYKDDISTADIGRAINLHPNYAMTLFRRECGMSIWQYLIRLRLSQAQLMLLTTDKTVLAIALESGFGSLARFYAAFTRECAISPGEFRKRALP
ncbi:MAG: transcriptional regulator, AraC family [Polyangiaceae bacterium]|jgi:AraC-like DNA-binding protein|nr:transcriptional regulator, AraC family [Polyangiaceae bacterium]